MATAVEIEAVRGTVHVVSGSKRERRNVPAGQTMTFPIHKDRPIVAHLSKEGRAKAKSTTGIVLLLEHEDADDGFVNEYRLKPPLKQAMIWGKWVIMAPNAA